MRPLGAVVFSHIGDKYGRRHMLLLSVALMTAAMLATALLRHAPLSGPAAGWLLLALRCVMGFSVGGEYTGVVAYLLKGARERRRGPDYLFCFRGERGRWITRGRRIRADRQPRQRWGSRALGLAYPLLRRCRTRRVGLASPAPQCTKARIQAPAR